jgi:hypothetical protein
MIGVGGAYRCPRIIDVTILVGIFRLRIHFCKRRRKAALT